jgi:hypothetical protein
MCSGAELDSIVEEGLPDDGQHFLDMIRQTSSVIDMNMGLVEVITRAADNILFSEPERLEGLEEKLVRFNSEALYMLDKIFTEPLTAEQKQHISIFNARLARAAEVLFYSTGDVSWGERCYDANIRSAEVSFDTDKEHAAYTYGFAANIAEGVYRKEGDISWAKKWFDMEEKCANMSRSFDRKHAGYTFGFAGDAARELFRKTGESIWAVQAYEMDMRCSEMTAEFDGRHAALMALRAAKFAGSISNRKKNISWAKRHYDANVLCIKIGECMGSDYIISAYKAGSYAARLAFNIKKNHFWSEKAYHINKRCSELVEESDRKGAAIFAAHAAALAGHIIGNDDNPVWEKQWLDANMRCLELGGKRGVEFLFDSYKGVEFLFDSYRKHSHNARKAYVVAEDASCLEPSYVVMEDFTGLSEGDNQGLEASSHLIEARAARDRFRTTGEDGWLDKWYFNADSAAKKFPSGHAHIGPAYDFAGNAAQERYAKSKNNKWLEKVFYARLHAADNYVETDRRLAAQRYSTAALIAMNIKPKTDHRWWLKKGLELAVKCAELLEDEHPSDAARGYLRAKHAAEQVGCADKADAYCSKMVEALKKYSDSLV